ncbi:hypothetical protein [Streptantibioticus ferralitis]|uniref:Uncharacterized protein n=1 Tax=Streptantibioticus ferralitis TaxID=236510 RepID=A0ABT5Z6T8_9ACTN|nr:hypothetical protein [Streptantibioticus ferralitis]MDF2259453.1 hypothetical protein [Streptantibioticus ferralitis]
MTAAGWPEAGAGPGALAVAEDGRIVCNEAASDGGFRGRQERGVGFE